jgi:cytochrome c oxidase assembly factor CtaG
MEPARFDLHTVLLGWQFGPFPIFVLVACIACIVWYLRADWALAARGRVWKARRTVAFVTGIVCVDLALQSPLATLSNGYFQAHVLQKLTLMIIAPVLLALGAPMTLILQTSGRRAKTTWLKIIHSTAFAVISHPIVVAMEHMWLMDLFNLLFLFAATLFWWPIVGLDPVPRWNYSYPMRMVNLLIGVPLESFLAVGLMSSRTPIAPMYSLSGSHAGAGLFWALTELFTMLTVIPIYFQWMASEDRKTARTDARLDAEAAIVAQAEATVGIPQPHGRWVP